MLHLRFNARRVCTDWGSIALLTMVLLIISEVAEASDCAPPLGSSKSCAAPRLKTSCAPRRKVVFEQSEDEDVISAQIAAAVAEALAAERERLASAPATTGAPTTFAAPAASGTVTGASNSIGLRGMEIHFPELKFALPTIQLPSLVRFRRDPELLCDAARAPMVNPASMTGAPLTGAPQSVIPVTASTAMPVVSATFAPAPVAAVSPPVASAPVTEPRLTDAPVRQRSRGRRVVRRVDCRPICDDEWEVLESDDSRCAPAAKCSPAAEIGSRTRQFTGESVNAPAEGGERRESRRSHPNESVPPLPAADDATARLDELLQAREELAAARRELSQLARIVEEKTRSRHDTFFPEDVGDGAVEDLPEPKTPTPDRSREIRRNEDGTSRNGESGRRSGSLNSLRKTGVVKTANAQSEPRSVGEKAVVAAGHSEVAKGEQVAQPVTSKLKKALSFGFGKKPKDAGGR